MTDLQKKYSWVSQQDYEIVAGADWPPYEIFCQHNNVNAMVYQEIDTMLSQPKSFDHPSFCVLPFYGKELPTNIACCLMQPNRISDVKKEMLAGIRPSACQKCWTLEDQGIRSDRLIKNAGLDFYLDKNISDIFQDCVDNKNQIVHYKIDTSNVCNAACVTCSDESSSTWAKLKQKNHVSHQKEWKITLPNLQDKIDFRSAKSISFRGGEPFLSDVNFQILEKLIEHNNHDCFVSFVTNGSFKLSNHQKNILKNFKNLNFCFSIDGVGPVFEYLRYPLKFDQIKENILYCRQNNIIASVSYTLSNINLLYHSQTTNWFKQQNLAYLFSPVYDPVHFRPSALPLSIKEYIHQNYNHSEIEVFLKTHSKEDDLNFAVSMKNIQQQDTWKNIHIGNYLPELTKLFEQSINLL